MNELVEAIRRCDANEFSRILSHHPNPAATLNHRHRDGWTLTHHAACGNSIEIMTTVLENGGDPLYEIPVDRNTPLHLALMSKQENSSTIAAILHSKVAELRTSPRRNREGNHPLHFASLNGNEYLVKELLLQNPTAKNKANACDMTPLGVALNNGHQNIVDILIGSTIGNPTQFEDFVAVFSSFNTKAQKYLSPIPVKVFVVGDNCSGKSTLIKSIQSESFYDRFWGVAWNTPNVPNNKVGLVPSDHVSKKFGKIIFHDLASSASFVNEDLLESADDLTRSMFIVVIDNRPEKKVMEQRLEFWLNFILLQCSRFSLVNPIYNQAASPLPQMARPNVLVVASFGELHSGGAFRNTPALRLNLVVRSVSRHNREITRRLNVVNYIALDCRKAESPSMTQVREELSKTCSQLRPLVTEVHCRCYILSDVLRQLEREAEESSKHQLPIMKLSSLVSLIKQRSSEGQPNLYQLLPQDYDELLNLCQVLEERGSLAILPSGRGEENLWIVYGKETIANKLDKLFVDYADGPGRMKEAIALMTTEVLEDILQPVAYIGMDLLTKLLELFKIHDRSVRELTRLPSDPPIFFFPTLLRAVADTNCTRDWETGHEYLCFGWSVTPSKDQVSRFFLPRFTKTLLLLLFQRCGELRDFEHRCLWSEGIHFQDKASDNEQRKLEITITVNSKAVILNMRYSSDIEISSLCLRNMILDEIRSHRDNVQPQTKVEESIIPKDGSSFPVSSPTLPRVQYSIEDMKKIISKSSLSLSAHSSATITSQISGSSGSLELQEVPFFEPCLFLPNLSLTNQLCLLRQDYVDSEITDGFLQNLREVFGPDHYKAFAEWFDLPIISNTPASSAHGSQLSIVLAHQRPHNHVQHTTSFGSGTSQQSYIGPKCNTFGKLVDCLDSVSIFNTVKTLERAQHNSPSRQLATPTNLYPLTTRLPSSSFSGVDLSEVKFVEPLSVISCAPGGGVFHSKSNDVTISIPEGAVPYGQPHPNVEFGVALLGPFEMPHGTEQVIPVSPFVWICVDTIEFSKPVTVILPHFISCDTRQDTDALTFLKADLRSIDEDGRFHFASCDDGVAKFKPRSMKGTITLQQSCFICIASECPSMSISKANYCLMMVLPSQQAESFEATFCFTYLLQTCIEVVNQQFPGFRLQRKGVKLIDTPTEEAEIKINFQSVFDEGWLATNFGGQWEIPASSVAFWNRNIDELEFLDRHKLYPPRFIVDVNGTSATKPSCLNVEFTGLKRRIQFQIPLQLTAKGPPSVLQREPSGEISMGLDLRSRGEEGMPNS